MEVFVARQPIFNRYKEVVAYELLYRDGSKNFFDNSISSSKATSILLINSYFSIGIENLIGGNKAFINFDKKLIETDIPLIFNNNTIVIELLEDIVPDKNFVEKIKKLKSKGYTIALDDFVYDYPYNELVELCDIVKVDFLSNSKEDIVNIIKKWKKDNKKFIAEKVETDEIFKWAKNIGFDYFQGYFFSKPKIVKGKCMKINNIHYIHILKELNKKDASYNKITKIIENNVNITYKLLKLVNSKFTFVNEIYSVKHALTILGLKEIERWISLIMIQDLSNNSPDEIFKLSIFRSKFGELLAKNSIYKNRKYEIMLMGLLSVIDNLLEEPMEKILKTLPLGIDIKKAMLKKESIFSDIYNLIIEYEKGSWSEILNYTKKLNININKLPNIYFKSIKWSDELFEYIKNAKHD
ncbi:EAL and HDOD domain-containing protein [Tepidibacter formicigenes]|jgi:EAL and modified HD-GYP domain-containing signal transduction protein|uniref:EAL and modified HD-GYP domain-containing signal transduction protein n=1 Tax=Tepidibacter formicigenes DSM 15518 TaxID=1123349 RepID=A0A1M6LWM6_9FIRM|nr:EAL domain-containing protein [Tepidibacter formicigenes]SHJ75608.1 EAL and modified HD-GYP domain-containing signal transduction protein [Tepidibacter formicigenes DSM 15518]